MNILLIGPRACGKSTVGPRLASRLNKTFIDLDQRALAQFPQHSVREVWQAHGEGAWRQAEVLSLRDALAGEHDVAALGGGVVMIAQARHMIEQAQHGGRAFVVYLRCPADVLVRRLRTNPGDRPPLSDLPLEVEVAQTLRSREPTYLAVADAVIDAAGPPDQVIQAILAEMR